MFHVEQNHFDIIVIGGGHAGAEAANIATQFELKVALISAPDAPLASTPCNPAVGGVGKGQVVREIDSLGGMMGTIADMSGIQFRTLNESKGFSVQSTRVQVDKDKYTEYATTHLESLPLEIIRKLVSQVTFNSIFTVECSDGSTYTAKKVIATTGTFLGGLLHTGEKKTLGGRVDCLPSPEFTKIFGLHEKKPLRFKTGTPPRIHRDSINFTGLTIQPSDPETIHFSYRHSDAESRVQPQQFCYLTETNSNTLSIIRANKERSPIWNGQIKGVGPRYCPSIEDKAYRYIDKDVHHVFLEPEGGANTDYIYPNGVSTSLPADVQESFLKTIHGLENCNIAVHGYAVEYDVVDTTGLKRSLESIEVPGLYFAGQVCGTSGYEEAAGLGIMAGINASLACLSREPLILDRNDSYIGVMIEDLVTNKRDEPYRLFTARSENRLYIREDNSIDRMYPYRKSLGLSLNIDQYQNDYVREVEVLTSVIKKIKFYFEDEQTQSLFQEEAFGPLNTNISFEELLKRPNINPIKVLEKMLGDAGLIFKKNAIRTAAIAVKYDGYIKRSNVEQEKFIKLAKKKIEWEKLVESKNISFECKLRIKEIKPETFGQLQRIEGIRPATIAYVAGNVI